MALEYRKFIPDMIGDFTDVMNASSKDVPYFEPMPVEQMRIAILENPDSDQDGILVAYEEGKPVASVAAVWSKSRAQHGMLQGQVQLGVLPEKRGAGIEQELMKRALGHLKEKGMTDAVFGSNSAIKWKLDLASDFGFVEMRRGYKLSRPMPSALPQVNVPEGIAVEMKDMQDADDAYCREFHGALNSAFRDHFNFAPLPFDQLMLLRKVPGIDSQLFLARAKGGAAAGICLSLIETINGEKKGDINAIGVLPDYRRKGIAKALMAQALSYHSSHGVTETGLSMEAQNARALSLYAMMGFEVKTESVMFIRKI